MFHRLSELIMYKTVRTRQYKKNMNIFHSKKQPFEIRTTKYLWSTLFLLIVLVHANEAHINFDYDETLWLKNISVHVFPIGNVHASIPSLKITGLAFADIEDGVQIKPTFSASDCKGNETELQIINTTAPTSANTELVVSLSKFHFKQHSEAYLCIQTKFDRTFQHMGYNSMFSK